MSGEQGAPQRARADVMMTEVSDQYTPGFLQRAASKLTGFLGGGPAVGGSRGHIEVTGSYICPADGAIVNVRDRGAKRHHPKGHRRAQPR